jgi:hypothetical protein
MILTRSLPAATYRESWPRHISLRLDLVAHQIPFSLAWPHITPRARVGE